MGQSGTRRTHWWRITRDTVTLTVGATAYWYEVVFRNPSDPTIVSSAVFLMITPLALRANQAIRERVTSDSSDSGKPARGYYRVLEDEKRWEQERDRFRRDWDRGR